MSMESSSERTERKSPLVPILGPCLALCCFTGLSAYGLFVREGPQDAGSIGLILAMFCWTFLASVAELNHRAKGGTGTIFQQPFWAWFGIAWAAGLLMAVAFLFR